MLITNANIITWSNQSQILEDCAILIRHGIIVEIGSSSDIIGKYPDEERMDAGRKFLMPGLICAHTHFYGAFSRGMGIPGEAPRDFPEILEKLWWPLDRSLDLQGVRDSAMVCLIDAIRHGTTTLVDHHASPTCISGSLDAIAEAVLESGLRAALCYEVSDRNGREGARAGIAENVKFVNSLRNQNNPYLAATFGLHASLTVSEATLEAARAACPDDIGFHVHVAEHVVDQDDALEKYGERVVNRLHRQRILGPKSIVVHAVHVDACEIEILADTKTWVTHQPRSNMNNAVGLPAVESMLQAGVKVGLGNDGFSNTMWEEWKSAYLAHKLFNRNPRAMQADKIVQMAIHNNACLVEGLFPISSIGRIVIGAAADLILVDYHPFTPLNSDNLPWHIIFGFRESMVCMTMVAGKVLMNNRKLEFLDEEKIVSDIKQRVPAVWGRYLAQF